MPFDFDQFCVGLKRAKFTNFHRSDEKALNENIHWLQFAWKEGKGDDVKRIANIICEKIKYGSVDYSIKANLRDLQTGKEIPPPRIMIPAARDLHPTTSTTDASNKKDEIGLADDKPKQGQKVACVCIEDVNMMLEILFDEVFGESAALREGNPTQRSDSREETKHIEQAFRSMSVRMKQCLKEKMKQQVDDLNICKMMLAETKGVLRKVIPERDEYLHRLSEFAGARLSHDSLHIPDLSNEYRPIKLAEKYSELYDDKWTDAYDAIAKNNSDEKTIEILVDVLQKAYSYCCETSEKQTVLLKSSLVTPTTVIATIEEKKRAGINDIKDLEKYSEKAIKSMGVEMKNLLFDMRKSCLKDSCKDLLEEFHLESMKKYRKNENFTQYVQECLKLTWLMVLQSPPLVLDDSVTRKGTFDKSRYREYTISGPKYDFLVWPALLIQKGGFILHKGVAQGLK